MTQTINKNEALTEVNNLLVKAEINLVRMSVLKFESKLDAAKHSRKLKKLIVRIGYLKYWALNVEAV